MRESPLDTSALTARARILTPSPSPRLPGRRGDMSPVSPNPDAYVGVLHRAVTTRVLYIESSTLQACLVTHLQTPDLHTCLFRRRRWRSNPSGKCSPERLTRGAVTSTMCRAADLSGGARCGAGACCSAKKYQSLWNKECCHSSGNCPLKGFTFRVSGLGLGVQDDRVRAQGSGVREREVDLV